jgi:hypothetical protein
MVEKERKQAEEAQRKAQAGTQDREMAREKLLEALRKAQKEGDEEAAQKASEALRRLRERQRSSAQAGEQPRPFRLGVHFEPVNPDVAAQLDLPAGKYAVIRHVVPGSPAEKAGFKEHDILLSFAGKEVQTEEISKLVGAAAGGKIDAVVLRKGRKVVIHGIEMGEQPKKPTPPTPPTPPSGASRADNRGEGRKDSTSNRVMIVNEEDDLKITIKAKAVDGKLTPESITIKDGDNEDTYDSLRRVPSKHRAKVQKLLEQSSKGIR